MFTQSLKHISSQDTRYNFKWFPKTETLIREVLRRGFYNIRYWPSTVYLLLPLIKCWVRSMIGSNYARFYSPSKQQRMPDLQQKRRQLSYEVTTDRYVAFKKRLLTVSFHHPNHSISGLVLPKQTPVSCNRSLQPKAVVAKEFHGKTLLRSGQ